MAVVKMHRKFGFVDEGLFKAHKWKNDEWHDVYRLAFFADTWRDTKDEIQAKVAPR
jgi:RimJ/RimL family protein N-acetyltransferase